jgi:hypothetical protein
MDRPAGAKTGEPLSWRFEGPIGEKSVVSGAESLRLAPGQREPRQDQLASKNPARRGAWRADHAEEHTE